MISTHVRAAIAAAAVTASMAIGSVVANAAPIYNGGYEATSVSTGGNLHTIWLPGLFSGVNAYWQFKDDSGRLNADAGAGTINVGGVIENNGTAGTTADYRFDVDMNFDYRAPYTGDPVNPLRSAKTGGGAVNSTWEFYDLAGATLTGLGDLMGLTLSLTQYPDGDQAFQIGDGANDKNSGLGASVWFDWSVQTSAGYAGPTVSIFDTAGSNKHGDLNLNLQPVPLPAAGWMLIAGVAGLGAMRRRRKAVN